MRFYILAMAALGRGLSGGDRIFIELSKILNKRSIEVTIYLWEEGYRMCQTQNLTGVTYTIWNVASIKKVGFLINYVLRILKSIKESLFLKIENNKTTIIYSASDFWMDSLPGWILKKRFPKATWIGTFYLAAPNPLFGFNEDGKKQIPTVKDTIYYFMQKLPYYLIRNKADLVCVTSEPDIDKFPDQKKSGRYLVIKGGVNFKGYNYSGYTNKLYDAVFQGRFHRQKGVLELLDIWKKVITIIPNARLAMIGDGPLMERIKSRIKEEKLDNNIKLFGYLFDGSKKDMLFKQSKIVVHPAIYDSGGMASAEAMAVGLPGVSFDLQALKSYYPYGLLKARVGDLEDFASKIVELLQNKPLYKQMSDKVIKLIKSEWTWEHRFDQFLSKVKEILNYEKVA